MTMVGLDYGFSALSALMGATQPVGTANWDGNAFEVWPFSADLPEQPGVYIYTRITYHLLGTPVHSPIYVGQSDNVGRRHWTHKNDPDISRHAQYVHFLPLGSIFPSSTGLMEEIEALRRDQIERLLISTHNPPLNTQHRTGPATIENVPDRYRPRSAIDLILNGGR